MFSPTVVKGATLIAQVLKELGIKFVFGLVGVPVVEIAEELIKLGIRFIAFRNEQAASYAATAYGYLTGRPGVCLVVGGPGVLHAMAGIGNASANTFPLLLLAGSCETHLVGKGAFQELDAVALLTPHTKFSTRATLESIPRSILQAFRMSWYGRGGPTFVDIPADIIQGETEKMKIPAISSPPRTAAEFSKIKIIADYLKKAAAPLAIIGKGAAYAQAEAPIRRFINQTKIPFLPTPMGKGVIPDSHILNTSSARSVALREADIILVLGAKLNWILHYGESPKWKESAIIIQVDISAEELGKNNADSALSIAGDVKIVISQLTDALENWSYDTFSPYMSVISENKKKNAARASMAAKSDKIPMTYGKAFDVIKQKLNELSPSHEGRIVFVSEGANTMDISRSVFPLEHPRLRLDAGTLATMGAGMGYAIAAHCAYNTEDSEGRLVSKSCRKKIVCLEGDSAFGFSLAEIETMSRYGMDIMIFVINNGGIYHGDCDNSDAWLQKQQRTIANETDGLRSTSLGYEVRYEKAAEMCGGKGYLVRTPEELTRVTEEGFKETVPIVVNVIIEAGARQKLEFAWQNNPKKPKNTGLKL